MMKFMNQRTLLTCAAASLLLAACGGSSSGGGSGSNGGDDDTTAGDLDDTEDQAQTEADLSDHDEIAKRFQLLAPALDVTSQAAQIGAEFTLEAQEGASGNGPFPCDQGGQFDLTSTDGTTLGDFAGGALPEGFDGGTAVDGLEAFFMECALEDDERDEEFDGSVVHAVAAGSGFEQQPVADPFYVGIGQGANLDARFFIDELYNDGLQLNAAVFARMFSRAEGDGREERGELRVRLIEREGGDVLLREVINILPAEGDDFFAATRNADGRPTSFTGRIEVERESDVDCPVPGAFAVSTDSEVQYSGEDPVDGLVTIAAGGASGTVNILNIDSFQVELDGSTVTYTNGGDAEEQANWDRLDIDNLVPACLGED